MTDARQHHVLGVTSLPICEFILYIIYTFSIQYTHYLVYAVMIPGSIERDSTL